MAKSQPTTDVATLAPTDLIAILTTPEIFDDLIGHIRKEVEEFVPDLTTVSGRKAIASLAYKVARTKTALDDAGKELNAEARKKIDAVDAVRRDVRAKLDDLSALARKPLDEWEAKEDDRLSEIGTIMRRIDGLSAAGAYSDSKGINTFIAELDEMILDVDVFQEGLEIAVNAKTVARENLVTHLERALKSEADAAELAELRRQNEERAAQEAARIAEEEAAREAERAEQQRIADAAAAEEARKAEIAAAEQRAADEAKAETARLAQIELDAANAEIEKANAEAKRLKDAEDARIAEETRIASETAAREADKAHRGAIMKAAKEAIMKIGTGDGINEATARMLVLAIVAGEIPNVRINF